MTRFIHSADWQLGMTRYFLSEEAQGRYAQDRIDAIRRVGELARTHAAEFVVVAGDVFESNQVTRQTVVRALEAMGEVGVPVLLLPGNHDPLDAASVFRSVTFTQRQPSNVVVLDGFEPVVPPGTVGVEVVGAAWNSKRPSSEPVGAMLVNLAPVADGVRILVGHGALDALHPVASSVDIISLVGVETALADNRIQYLALGDHHSVNQVGGTGRVWYSGTPVATDFDEQRPGYALLVDLVPGGTPRVEELPVGEWRFANSHHELDRAEDVAALARFLDEQPNKARTVLRLTIVGALEVSERAHLDEILGDYGDDFASLHIWERHSQLAVLSGSADIDALRLSGYARDAWEALAERAKGEGEDARAAADALALMYRLAGGGSTA